MEAPVSAYLMPSPEIQGWMNRDELDWLYDRACEMKEIVEVGAWKGRSTHALLSGALISGGRVFSVDHFRGNPSELADVHAEAAAGGDAIYDQFLANVGGFPNLAVIRMDSLEAASMFPDHSVDMVFIDGEHQGASVLADLAAWAPKVTKLLCGHDRYLTGVYAALRLAKIAWEPAASSIWLRRSEEI